VEEVYLHDYQTVEDIRDGLDLKQANDFG
jgi:hypothetical protein